MSADKPSTTTTSDRLKLVRKGGEHGKVEQSTLDLLVELKNLSTEILGKQLDRMFDGADDMLFEMAKRATSNDDQRVFFDTMRVVRIGRPQISQRFRDELLSNFAPDHETKAPTEPNLIDFDELTLQESNAVEETIAVSNMATKAEGLYKNQVWEIERRFNFLIKEKNAPLSSQALAPATLCAAFKASLSGLDVEFAVQLIIYKLFDRLVISDLLDLYNSTLRFLEGKGIKPQAVAGAVVRPASAAPTAPGVDATGAETLTPTPFQPGAPAMGGVPGYVPTPPSVRAGMGGIPAYAPTPASMPGAAMSMGGGAGYAIDAQTMGSLQSLGSQGAVMPQQYTDSMLASDITSAAQGGAVQGWSVPQAFAYVQRTGLVGKMFNDILADPNLPPSLKPQFDQLRFSVIKSALKDSNFFANPNHPVRGIVNELATMAAAARANGQETLQRIEDLVGQIRGQFDVAADQVKSAAPNVKAVEDSEIERFIEQQAAQTKSRRQAIVAKTRRIVAEELQLRTAGMNLPEPVRPLLNSGWAPMMALRLLRHGPDSEPWVQGLKLLDRILASLRVPPGDVIDEIERASLGARLREDLRDVGMEGDRSEVLINGLSDAWIALDQANAEVEANRLQKEAEREAARAAAAAVAAERAAEAPEDVAALEGEPDFGLPSAESDAAEAAAQPDGALPVADAEAEEAVAESAAPAPATRPTANDPVALLDLLVVPGNWFLVYDRQLKSNRWLKAVLRYRDKDLDRGSVAFAEFNGKNTLLVKAQEFIEDLIARRTEPIDLSPAAKHAFDEFLAAQRSASIAA